MEVGRGPGVYVGVGGAPGYPYIGGGGGGSYDHPSSGHLWSMEINMLKRGFLP